MIMLAYIKTKLFYYQNRKRSFKHEGHFKNCQQIFKTTMKIIQFGQL